MTVAGCSSRALALTFTCALLNALLRLLLLQRTYIRLFVCTRRCGFCCTHMHMQSSKRRQAALTGATIRGSLHFTRLQFARRCVSPSLCSFVSSFSLFVRSFAASSARFGSFAARNSGLCPADFLPLAESLGQAFIGEQLQRQLRAKSRELRCSNSARNNQCNCSYLL